MKTEMKLMCIAVAVSIMFSLCSIPAMAKEPIIVPIVEDPVPIIDGKLSDWHNRGVFFEFNGPDQVTYHKSLWKGSNDLSGSIRLGHDKKKFYLVANVKDDTVSQPLSGEALWKGDHVMLLLDFVGQGNKADLIQIGISPGSLTTGGKRADTKPEIVIWRPEGLDSANAEIFC